MSVTRVSVMDASLQHWLQAVLGEHSVVSTRSATARRRGEQPVLEVADRSGDRWFLKPVATQQEWRGESRAYRHWVPKLGDAAPTLKAGNAELRTLLVSAVPGEEPKPTHSRSHREAGRLLRLFHEAAPARSPGTSGRPVLPERLRRAASSSSILTADERNFVQREMTSLQSLPQQEEVPCHADYLPHNWLVDDTGTLRVIDFGNARWATAVHDLTKLCFGPWWRRPDLTAAFFEGYGRSLTPTERQFLQHYLSVDALREIMFGHQHGSTLHLDHGRSRLADLMNGYRLGDREAAADRLRRAVRPAVRAVRALGGQAAEPRRP